MKVIDVSIAENIQARSKELGLSMTELAEQANMSKRTVHSIWSGESKDPKISNIKKIAIALGTSTDKLIFDEDIKDDLRAIFRELENLEKEQKNYAKKVLRAIIIQSKNEQLSK